MKFIRAAFLLSLFPFTASAEDFENKFSVVFIDAQTEAKYGSIPLNRTLMAKAIRRLSDAGAKGVVLKFFLDQSKNDADDRQLADALAKIPVVLQARMDDTEPAPNPLANRFTLTLPKTDIGVAGKSGWIPLPRFADKAKDICFVDFNSAEVPVIESYQGRFVKSLTLCAMELSHGKKAEVKVGKSVEIGQSGLKLNARNQVQVALIKDPKIQSTPFHVLLDGKLPDSLFKNKVVILGYDGPNIHSVKSSIGEFRAHMMFVIILKSMYEGMYAAGDSGRKKSP